MAKPVLYGTAMSRAIRSIWAMEECGIEFDHIPTKYNEQSKTSEYLAHNANGRIPTLVDGDLTLFESMAINQHLARTYCPDLQPANAAEEALTQQWSVWGISEIEPLQMRIVVQKFFTPEEKQNPKTIESAVKGLQRPLAVLDAHLADQDYLLGDRFTIADLNVSSVMLLLQQTQTDCSAFKNVTRWTDACYARPALKRAKARD